MRLTIACSRNPLTDALGEAGFGGPELEINHVTKPVMQLFAEVLSGDPFDVVEFSLANHIMAVGAGDRRYVGLPLFTFRGFRHSMLWVREDSTVERPEDLRGKRVGITAYALTALVYVRGLLSDEYGVHPEDIEWVRTGRERLAFPPPPGVTILDASRNVTPFDLLRAGDVHAIIAFWSAEAQTGALRRLLPEVANLEADYFRRTGIYPIMHCFALSRAVYEQDPRIASALMNVFLQAKKRWRENLETYGAESVAITPWTPLDLERSRAILGADLYPYGLESNRRTLSAAARYTREQHLIGREVDLSELFVPAEAQA